MKLVEDKLIDERLLGWVFDYPLTVINYKDKGRNIICLFYSLYCSLGKNAIKFESAR